MTTTETLRSALAKTSLASGKQAHFADILQQVNEDMRTEVCQLLTEQPQLAETLYENLLAKANSKDDDWDGLIKTEEQQLENLTQS